MKVHVSDILRKLNVLSRTKAIVEMSKIDFANLAAKRRSPIALRAMRVSRNQSTEAR